MTYKEIAEQLNKKYNTDIFMTDYDGNIVDRSSIFLDAKSELGKTISVEVDIESLEVRCVILNTLNANDVIAISKANIAKDKQIEDLKLQVQKEKENADYWRNKDRASEEVKEFAQDTILKAIKG